MNIYSFFIININRTKVIKRLKRFHQKFPYALYEYNHTGIKLTRNESPEIEKDRIASEITRFLNLIIPIHIKRESNENIIANITYINTRIPTPNHKLNINQRPLKETKNEKIPIIPVIRDIHHTIVKRVVR